MWLKSVFRATINNVSPTYTPTHPSFPYSENTYNCTENFRAKLKHHRIKVEVQFAMYGKTFNKRIHFQQNYFDRKHIFLLVNSLYTMASKHANNGCEAIRKIVILLTRVNDIISRIIGNSSIGIPYIKLIGMARTSALAQT